MMKLFDMKNSMSTMCILVEKHKEKVIKLFEYF